MRDKRKEERIAIFNSVRDIPYRIPLGIGEEDNCCNGKHQKLQKLLGEAGYWSVLRECEFRWSKLPLPQEILEIPHDDYANHVYLVAGIHADWGETLDATWDCGLRNILPVNIWDGDSRTPLAVPWEVDTRGWPENIQKEKESSEDNDQTKLLEALKINGKFFRSLNEWLEKNRRD